MARPIRGENNPALTSQAFEVTLESIWDDLLQVEKAFIIAFPHFDTYRETCRFIGKPWWWYDNKVINRPLFKVAVAVRKKTSHDAAVSLLKQDLATKALVRTHIDIIDKKLDNKEIRQLLKTFTGKIHVSKGPSRQGNLVDLASVRTWEDDEGEEEGD